MRLRFSAKFDEFKITFRHENKFISIPHEWNSENLYYEFEILWQGEIKFDEFLSLWNDENGLWNLMNWKLHETVKMN